MSAERLREIHKQMNDLLEEAKNIVRCANRNEYDRAKAYWIGWIDNALNKNNHYDTTMLDTIKAIDYDDDSEEDEECFNEDLSQEDLEEENDYVESKILPSLKSVAEKTSDDEIYNTGR